MDALSGKVAGHWRVMGQSSGDQQLTTLTQRLAQLATLADRLPPGDGEDHVRRSVQNLIAATSADQRAEAMNLLRSIVRLRHERQQGHRRSHQHGSLAVDRLFSALCDTVVPLL